MSGDVGKHEFVLHWVDGLSWEKVGETVGLTGRAAKSRSWRWENAPEHQAEAAAMKRRDAPKLTRSEGVSAGDTPGFSEEEIVARAIRVYATVEQQASRRSNQRLEFDHGPVALVLLADTHLGDSGVDYQRVFDEAQTVAETPGMYAVLAGDVLNNFVVGKLRQARDDAQMSIPEEWALVRHFLRIISGKLVAVVSGNHDHWTKLLAGVDYFRDVVADQRRDVLYDAHDVFVTVAVGGWEVPTRIRHRWRGNSIYNPTHGIERSVKFDRRFLIGMGAHTHVSGLTRSFNVEGNTGIALLAGSYKRVDSFARRQGFPMANQSTAVTVVLDEETESLTGYDNLEAAARYMRLLYGERST